MPVTLGTGEHERPVMEAIMLGVRDLSMEMQEVKAMVVESWKFKGEHLQETRLRNKY